MSEPFDPIDKAYKDAESALADDAARAARRARVLAAVTEAPLVAPRPRISWRIVGSLSAAGVAGVVVLLANRIDRPPSYAPADSAIESAVPPHTAGSAGAKQDAQPPRPMDGPPRGATASSRAEPQAPLPMMSEPAMPVVTPPPVSAPGPGPGPAGLLAPPAPSPPALDRGDSGLGEIVVTASKRQLSSATVERLGERLRVAARRGDEAEVERLLARGVPVDETDEAGETALMKSIKAKRVATVVLLRSRGASLEAKNTAGQTARDLAAAINDPELNRALEPN